MKKTMNEVGLGGYEVSFPGYYRSVICIYQAKKEWIVEEYTHQGYISLLIK